MIKDISGQDQIIDKPANYKLKIIGSLVLLIAFAYAAHAIMSGDTSDQSILAERLQIAHVTRGDLSRDILANGRVIAANAPTVYASAQGYVSLLVKAGDKVSKGQTIATIDSPELNNLYQQELSELLRLQGELKRQELDSRRQTLQLNKQLDLAKVDLQAAQRESRRAHQSIQSNVISQLDLEKSIDDLARAELNFAHAQQDVEISKDSLAFELESSRSQVEQQALVVEELTRRINELDISASVTGVVGNLMVQDRALVDQHSPLLSLVDLSEYEAEVKVAEASVNELSIGLPVEMKIGRETVLGELIAISPEIIDREVSARIKFNQTNHASLRQNQQVNGRIILDTRHDVLKVRRGTFTQAGGRIAFKVNGNTARKVDVELGAYSLKEVEILSGLQENDQIIVSNYESFVDSDQILLRQ